MEMAITRRPPSDLPAQVAEGVLGISPRGRRRELVALGTHWFNNTGSGLGRAALAGAGISGAPAVLGTFGLYLGGGALLFTRLGIAPAVPRPVDLLHAGVYAAVTSSVYERLEGSSGDRPDLNPSFHSSLV